MKKPEIITSDDVLEALKLWHGGEITRWPLAHMRLSLHGDNNLDAHSSLAETGPAARNRSVLSMGLNQLQGVAPAAHDLLRERFEHGRDVMMLANRMNIAESTLMYRQRQAVKQLAEVLLRMEDEASVAWQEKMNARLPLPTYYQLVGIEEPRDQLMDALNARDSQFIAAIDGIGGIGKTSLADHVVRFVIQSTRFEEIAWVTTKQTHLSSRGRLQVESGRPSLTFPMLLDRLSEQFDLPDSQNATQLERQRMVKQHLKERACLVVIDNLETVADYRNLLPELRQWQRPSKFLLTSRRRLLDEAGVFSVSLEELPENAAYELIRMEAERAGFSELIDAEAGELNKIYDVVGGNPLALKLLVGQLRFYSLQRVLERFTGSKEARSQDGLFDYIYREIWENLSDTDKTALLALMDAGATGFSFAHLVDISGLPEAQLEESLEELILLSLVDLAGNLAERRYRLHRLTEVFLRRMFGD